MSASFLHRFATLEDPRVERNQRHALLDIVLLTVCAVASGADGWEAIEDFGREKLGWLRRFARFENGVPSHEGIANVVSRLTPKGFGECFRRWTQAVTGATGGEIVAVDGKSARGSRDRRRGRSARPLVSAWACRNRLVLGQEATAEKSNEIAATPKLLEILELKGSSAVAWWARPRRWSGATSSTPSPPRPIASPTPCAVTGGWRTAQHSRLDTIFREDASRIRKGNAPAILTAIRHLALNPFEQEPSKLRLSQKRRLRRLKR